MKMILFTRKLNISTVKLRIKMIHFKTLTIAVHEFCKFCISMKKKKKEKSGILAFKCERFNSSHTVAYNPNARRAYGKSQHAEDFGRIKLMFSLCSL